MNKKLLIYFLFSLFLISQVVAVPPVTQVSQTINTLQIAYPKAEVLEINGIYETQWHVFNSTGFMVTNKTTECIFHLYNTHGNHIYQNKSKFSSNGIDFEFPINTSLFKDGLYPYIIQCNNSIEAGFVSGTIEMSQIGKSLEATFMFGIIFGIFCICLILILIAFLISSEHEILKSLLYFSSLLLSIYIPLAIMRFFNSTNAINLYKNYLYIIYIVFIYLFIYYFVYSLMLKWGWIKNGKQR